MVLASVFLVALLRGLHGIFVGFYSFPSRVDSTVGVCGGSRFIDG